MATCEECVVILSLNPKLTRRRLASLLSGLVVLAMLSLTYAYVYSSQLAFLERQERLFDVQAEKNYHEVSQRLVEMAIILRGVKGHYEASEYISKKEYYDYFSALDLGVELSGFQAISIANVVSNKSLPAFLDSMRQVVGPDFQIKPKGVRDEYAPISLMEPHADDNLAAVGFDLYSNALVKSALLKAKNTGKMAMTGKMSLVQDKKRAPASVMYIPIYDTSKPLTTVAERVAAHIGWVCGAFLMNDFMASLSQELDSDVGVRIVEQGDGFTRSYLYGELKPDKQSMPFNKVKPLEVGGVHWVLEMYARPSFNNRFAEPSYFPAVIGVGMSLLMGGLVWMLGSGRAKAVDLAKEMTRELRSSEATFRAMAETIPLAIYVSTVDKQTSEYVNPTFEYLFGYSKVEIATVDAWWQLACPTKADYLKVTKEWKRHIAESHLLQHKTKAIEMTVRSKDGSEKYISWRLMTVANKVYAFGYDLTETKLAEIELQIAAVAFESQSGMMVIDANKNILRVNAAFEKITGYSLNEMSGKRVAFLNSGKQDKAFYQAMWHDIDSKGFWEGEVWNKRKNGEVYPEYLNIISVTKGDSEAAYYVGTFNDITSTKVAAAEIQHLAYYDSLTQLPNRRYLLNKLTHALAVSKRNHHSGALLFLDLDDFKTLNDTLGHVAGDLLLQKVATRLSACVRESDTVARFGGDEFILLLEGLKNKDAQLFMEVKEVGLKVLDAISQPYDINNGSYFSSASIGITLFGSQQNDASAEDLLRQADIAMYQAKVAGRNALSFFDAQMQEAINVRASMERELRTAVKENQFQLYYQIQVDDTGNPFGVEALIRWQHPDKGMVSPAQFIPLAEDSGLIMPIGQWVLETACQQLAAWKQDDLMQHLAISVNVSAKQFYEQHFVSQVKAIIERYGVNPLLLRLELTESVLLEDVDHIIAVMNALNEVGIHFELDDFGTGYSSLQYLRRLPLSQLKIDQSFVREITTDSSSRTIVLTIITMAHTLGLDVIAEGVETEEQRQYLLENGCQHFQGYLFSKPLPIAALEAMFHVG